MLERRGYDNRLHNSLVPFEIVFAFSFDKSASHTVWFLWRTQGLSNRLWCTDVLLHGL